MPFMNILRLEKCGLDCDGRGAKAGVFFHSVTCLAHTRLLRPGHDPPLPRTAGDGDACRAFCRGSRDVGLPVKGKCPKRNSARLRWNQRWQGDSGTPRIGVAILSMMKQNVHVYSWGWILPNKMYGFASVNFRTRIGKCKNADICRLGVDNFPDMSHIDQ